MATPQNGTVSVQVNGETLRVKGPVTYALGGKIREEVMGQTGMLGFKVTPTAAITLNLENGKTISLDRASFVGPVEVSSEEGEFEIKFVGAGGREIG